MRRAESGYTLTEIIVAVAVIAILAGAMTPLIFKQIDRSRVARATQDLKTIEDGFIQYYADTQYWPCGWDADEDKNAHKDLAKYTCLYESESVTGWDGPYINESGGKNGSDKTIAAAKISGTQDYEGVVDPWARPFRLFLANTSTDGAEYGTVVIYSKGKNQKVDTSDADLLQGKSSGDDIVRIVSRKAAD